MKLFVVAAVIIFAVLAASDHQNGVHLMNQFLYTVQMFFAQLFGGRA